MKAAIAVMAGACLLAAGCGGEERIEHTKAKVEQTRAQLQAVEQALELYGVDLHHYPTGEEGGLEALTVKPTFKEEGLAERWRGPYLSGEARDAWGRPFHYEVVPPEKVEAAGVRFRLWSDGPDSKSGTADDVTNAPEKAPAGEAKP